MEASIYIDLEDVHTVEAEERNAFVRGILEEVGLPLDDIWPEAELTVEQKIELRRLLSKFDVMILDDGDRGLEIYVGDDLIATWHKPRYILHIDRSQRDPSKKIFYELILNFESLFDESEEEFVE